MRIDASSSSQPIRDFPVDKQDLDEIKNLANMINAQVSGRVPDYKDASDNLGKLIAKFHDLESKGNLNFKRYEADIDRSFNSINLSIQNLAQGCQSPSEERNNIGQETSYLVNLAAAS